jgi:hypothetical protein
MVVGNLEFIKSAEITSSVSTFNIEDCFSANYDVYKIVTNEISTTGTATTGAKIRLINSSGSVVTASNYDYAYLSMTSASAFVEVRSTNNTFVEEFFGLGYQSPQTAGSVTYCFNPFSSSSYTFFVNQSTSGSLRGTKNISVLKQAASMTGFQLLDSTGARPFGSGKISVYGVK